MSLQPQTVEKIQDYARRYPSAQSAILPALWAVQDEQGYVTAEALAEVAEHLKLPASLIEATSSFYSMFLTRPEGRHEVMICVNAPCMLRGADEIVSHAERRLGIRDGQTTSDGAITLRSTIECLGACGGAPMMQVDHRFEENLTPERVDVIFERLRTEPAAHRGVAPGPAQRPTRGARGVPTERSSDKPAAGPGTTQPMRRSSAGARKRKAQP